MPRRRIYSELVPLDVLVRSPALPELARRGMQLLFAVQPGQLEGALALLERAAELDLSAGVWPLIDDAHGRWLNPRHARVFETWATQLLDVVEASGAPMDAVVLDLGLDGARRTALERLVAFAELGADCLYAPGVRDPEAIREIVAAVAPRPVNVLVSAPAEGLTLRRLEDLGVRRVSVGSALARVAWGAFIAAAREIRDSGTFEGLGRAAAFAELNALFEAR